MKTFGHKRPVRKAGELVYLKPSPATAVTNDPYSVLYTKARRIVVCLEAGDIISFRELGRRHKWYLAVDTAFRYAVRCKAAADRLEKVKKRKQH